VIDGTPPQNRRSLKSAAANLAASLLGLVRTRLELASVEFEEARARAAENLVLVLFAGLFLAFAILAASMLVVVWFWDTHRIAALFGVTIMYLLLALLAAWRITSNRKADAPAFAATMAEFERDRAWLGERFGDGK
jgi:uncharacterized membrane protein YqjE